MASKLITFDEFLDMEDDFLAELDISDTYIDCPIEHQRALKNYISGRLGTTQWEVDYDY